MHKNRIFKTTERKQIENFNSCPIIPEYLVPLFLNTCPLIPVR